ncbi:hypothetical protein CXF85_11205 [Colwellia sp. 75C3]|uniref:diguanylate cyclase domain-containing protein n=1 Tax=Colwellia sp. 75C3 TaxID=888425 RepID=UPI000C3316E0|nr:diguanylate cyclase [Colwellia sp. 75C3]PKG83290.1 hypothetical protein CXF85_11205 [Colwellia sp. 75C3]
MEAEVNNVSRSKRLYKTMGNTLSYLNSIPQKFVGISEKPTNEIEFSTMLCTLTGTLNRIGLCGSEDLIVRWDMKEFLLVCPIIPLEHAINLATKISKNINNKIWTKKRQISCRSGIAQTNGEDLHDLITHITKELHKSKENA